MAVSEEREPPRSALWRILATNDDDEAALTADIIAVATEYGRYGYRRITAMLKKSGWVVNKKRVERIWRQSGRMGRSNGKCRFIGRKTAFGSSVRRRQFRN